MSLPIHPLSGSKADLAEACAAAMALVKIDSQYASATHGSDFHGFVYTWATWDRANALRLLETTDEALQRRCEGFSLDALIADAMRVTGHTTPPRVHAEIAFALSPDDGRAHFLGYNLGRDYSAAPAGTIPSSLDLVFEWPDEVFVPDLKTGVTEVPHPDINRQVHIGVAAARAHFDKPFARGAIAKVHEDGSHTLIVSKRWDAMAVEMEILPALAGIVRRVREAQAAVNSGADIRPFLKMGSHCSYCPARFECPAIAAEAQLLVPMMERTPTLTADTVAKTYPTLLALEKFVERAKGRCQDFARDAGGVELANGQTLAPIVVRNQAIDVNVAMDVLLSTLGGADQAMAAFSTSKAAIERAVGKADAPAVLTQIGERGGIATVTTTQMRVTGTKRKTEESAA